MDFPPFSNRRKLGPSAENATLGRRFRFLFGFGGGMLFGGNFHRLVGGLLKRGNVWFVEIRSF